MAETIKYGILLQLRDQVTGTLGGVQKGLLKFKDNIDGASRTARRGLLGLAAAVGAVAYKSMEQEKADRKLKDALIGAGDASTETYDRMKDLAAGLQKVTVYGDEATQGMIANALNLGITADKMDDAIEGAIGLAEALEMDLATALRYTALAMQGEFTVLQRYVPALRQTEDPTEKLAIVTELMAKGFHQAKGRAEGLEGSLIRLKNTFGDLLETLGQQILGTDTWAVGLEKLIAKIGAAAKWVRDLTDAQKESILTSLKVVAVTLAIVAVLGPLAGALASVIGLVKALLTVTGGTVAGLATFVVGLLLLTEATGATNLGLKKFAEGIEPLDWLMTSLGAGAARAAEFGVNAASKVASAMRFLRLEALELREGLKFVSPALVGFDKVIGFDPKQAIADLKAANEEAKRLREESGAVTEAGVAEQWRQYEERHPEKGGGKAGAPGRKGEGPAWPTEQDAEEGKGLPEQVGVLSDELLPMLAGILQNQKVTKAEMERLSRAIKKMNTSRR